MRNILIAIVALFTFAGAQAAEPRANKGKVNKVIKAIKELDSRHVSVKEYDADSVADDIKKQLYEQFDEKKVDKVWKANKITLNKSILAASQDEEGYNSMRAFVAKLNIENSDDLAGVPMTMNNKSDSVAIALFSDKNNMFIFIDSLLNKKYSIAYTDDDITTKAQEMLTQLVNDEFESISEGGLIKKFTTGKGEPIVFGAADDEKKEEPTGIKSITKYFDRLGDEVYHDQWGPYESAIYCAFTFRDRVSVIRNRFKKSKYTYEDECPSIHYYEGIDKKAYDKLSGNIAFYLLSKHKVGTKISNMNNMECIWAADTLGMCVRQYRGMKNVNLYLVDIPEKQQCATLIVNGGLDAFKAFFNSYTLNEEDNFADKYNVTYTTGKVKIVATKEEVNGKKSGLHLKYPILDEAYSKGLLPYYKRSE
ncbi:MAG: hypothetical protein IJD05_00940 [Bacteroidaceae bacterium]|nr:hypothetical protein [Bacteroidaceae bacterium]MBQ4038058.1 hypothetical protein [Bacteroidaceae bacterium]